ncbi:hypothetical protein [Methylobacterium nodulans]|uniref:Uncharacterized protein n=1 Tax=Methylobacterium nodulans (strain LMG 21967 / CNCM I-2342 / ORS 2060) TaxID=460265 RepID=B8ITR4_METNO|nr:hypothetical protein [Methylobacterium nodulans]ACL58980.1 hypothetical protein Mnod_4101 [Methylobacterium nodulans ORS 2060]
MLTRPQPDLVALLGRREPPRTYLAHFVDASGRKWIEETTVDNGLTAIAAFLAADERQGSTLREVYELDITDPLVPVARNVTAMVLGKVVDLIDHDDERDALPASVEDAARRHGVVGPAEKAPADVLPFTRLTPACVGVATRW